MSAFHLRPVTPTDAVDVAEIFNQPKVIDGTFRLPFTPETGIADWLASGDSDRRFVIAEVSDRAVGFVLLQRGGGRLAHVGELFLCVHDQFQRRGIGRALMHAALDIADNWMGLVRVELDVMVPNAGAIALYRSMGFQVEGRARAGTLMHGEYVDHYIMSRIRLPPRRRTRDAEEAP